MYRTQTVITGGDGGDKLSTMFFGAFGTTSAETALAATNAFWTSARALISSALHIETQVDVATIDETTGLITALTAADNYSADGTNSVDRAPAATQGLLRFQTGVYAGGRAVQGHLFIPGVTEDYNSNGRPSTDYKTYLATYGDDLLGASGASFGIYSRKNHLFYPANHCSVWDEWAVLRSRRD